MAKRPVYVVAVSGGVDSVVLLHKLIEADNAELVVAHFDHGIRPDSAKDRKFVESLAKKYDLAFEYAEGKLGPGASEDRARSARYKFLRSIQKKYQAEAIVTAHHQDDVIETAIINLLRGTKSRGLSSLSSKTGLERPLLKYTKFTIVNFAITHHLKWREDNSNQDTRYLRNYVRLVLIPKLDEADPGWRVKFLSQIKTAGQLNQAIEQLLMKLDTQLNGSRGGEVLINRSAFAELPGEVGCELVRRWLSRFELKQKIDQKLIKRVWLFAKTARPGAKLELAGDVVMKVDAKTAWLAKTPK